MYMYIRTEAINLPLKDIIVFSNTVSTDNVQVEFIFN